MIWNKAGILAELRRRRRAGEDLSYNGLARRKQSLLSAAAYHFGSYRAAVEKAGIFYGDITRRPRWTRARIIALIKTARKRGEDLHWSAVTRRRDELGRAAFASLQPRLFGKWERALQASGLDAEEIARYRRWDRDSILYELRARASDGEALNSGALQRDDAGLHAAAVREFKSYDAALRAAKLSPELIRRRRTWRRADVIQTMKSMSRQGASFADGTVRRDFPALYGAAVRLFGSFDKARTAAGVKFAAEGRGKKPSSRK